MLHHLNIWAVLVAGLASFAFGALWYSPIAFLKPWCKATGVNPEENITNPAKTYGLTFLATIISSFFLAVILGPDPMIMPAIHMAVMIAAGLIATSMLINYQFVGSNFIHWIIDSCFHLVRFVIMAAIIASWS